MLRRPQGSTPRSHSILNPSRRRCRLRSGRSSPSKAAEGKVKCVREGNDFVSLWAAAHGLYRWQSLSLGIPRLLPVPARAAQLPDDVAHKLARVADKHQGPVEVIEFVIDAGKSG